jgi:hypothetical protein
MRSLERADESGGIAPVVHLQRPWHDMIGAKPPEVQVICMLCLFVP